MCSCKETHDPERTEVARWRTLQVRGQRWKSRRTYSDLQRSEGRDRHSVPVMTPKGTSRTTCNDKENSLLLCKDCVSSSFLFSAVACSYLMNNVASPLVSRRRVGMKCTQDDQIYRKQGIFTSGRSTKQSSVKLWTPPSLGEIKRNEIALAA